MTQNNKQQICPICDETYIKSISGATTWMVSYECERCGKYNIGICMSSRQNQPWSDVRHFVSAWIRRENKAGLIPNIGDESENESIYDSRWWSNRFNNMDFPETTSEKINKLLVAYAESVDGDYNGGVTLNQPYFISEIAAKSQQEVRGLTRLMGEMGFLDLKLQTITAKGWLHIQESNKNNIESNSAFIAMWFSDFTTNYRNAVIAALEYCGYKPVIVDQQEYNDFIMNQVVSSIRQSRFLVADFTSRPEIEKDGKVKNGVRGGVYWEAGMAYGLGRPVLHTCEDNTDSKNRIHFDVDQYNTIYWKEDELSTEIRPLDQIKTNPNFAEKLAARILATIGKGTYVPKK